MIRRLAKISSTRSYLFSLVFRRDSHSQVRTIRENERNTKPKEKKGQHLLTNTRVLDAIVQSCDVKPTDRVLEIGPGTGNLTMKLLEAAYYVVAVEKDKCMVEILHKRVSENGFQDKLTVIQQDFLMTNLFRIDLVVANNISSPLIEKLVYGPKTFRSATLLLQKEFSRRLLANPGDSNYNRLAANVKLVADVKFVMDVSKSEFVPPPKVDSSVVMIIPKEVKPDVDVQEWLAFTRMCFANKNKTLGSIFREEDNVISLRTYSALRSDDFDSDLEDELEEKGAVTFPFNKRLIWILSSSGFEEKRPSNLSHVELLQLLNIFNKTGVFFHYKKG